MEYTVLSVDIKLLKQQILAVLGSDMSEDNKSGLHSFLGDVFDNLEIDRGVVLNQLK